MKKRRFQVDGQYYDIPENEVQGFLSEFPKAAEVRYYELGGNKYNVPIAEVDAFEIDMGLKKKVGGDTSATTVPQSNSEVQSTGTPEPQTTAIPQETKVELPLSEMFSLVDERKRLKAFKQITGLKGSEEKLSEIGKKFADAGHDADVIEEAIGDLPPYANVDLPHLLKEREENKLSFQRTKSAYKWQSPLFKGIREKEGERGEYVIANLVHNQGQAQTYEAKRATTKQAIDAIRTYVDDSDEQEKQIAALANDKAYGYGLADDDTVARNGEKYGSIPNLNLYHLRGLQFLEDTNPQAHESFTRLLAVTPEDNSGIVGQEYKYRELESLGMGLQKKALEEVLTNFVNKHNKGGLSEEEKAAYANLYDRYTLLGQDVATQKDRYQNAAALDADAIAQESIAQRNGAFKKFVLGVGENVDDAVNWIGDVFTSPFLSKEQQAISDLEDFGDKKYSQTLQQYTVEGNRLLQSPYSIVYSEPLQKELDKIKADESLSDDDKVNKARELILANQDMVGHIPNANSGKFNLTANSFFNAVSDVGKEIFSQVALGALTGGLGNVSKARQLSTLFGTVYATAYGDYYTEAIEKNIPNPSTYATVHTAIEAASELLHNDFALVKKMTNPKSSLGKILDNVSKEQWEAIAKAGKNRFRNLPQALAKTTVKSLDAARKETFEELAGQITGNIADDETFGQDVDVTHGLKETVVNTFVGMLPLGFLGVGGQMRTINRSQQYALYEVAQNPEKYLLQLEKDVESGIVKPSDAQKIKDNIAIAVDVLNKVQPKGDTDNKRAYNFTNEIVSVILPEDNKRAEKVIVIAPKEVKSEPKSKGAKVILPQNNTKPNIVTKPETEQEKEAIMQKHGEGEDLVEEKSDLSNTKVVNENGKPLTVYHSTLEKFDDFKDGVTYFAEDKEYSRYVAKLMNKEGRSYKEIKDEEVQTIPVKLKAERVYELPKGTEMNSNYIKYLMDSDPDFTKKYDAVKGIDLYSDNKVVYAVFDKSKILSLRNEEGKAHTSGIRKDIQEGRKNAEKTRGVFDKANEAPATQQTEESLISQARRETRQQQVNSLIDRVASFNKMPRNAKGRSQEINQIRIAANELGLTFDDRGGRLLNSSGSKIQKVNVGDRPGDVAVDFDANTYKPETRSAVDKIVADENLLIGLPIGKLPNSPQYSYSQKQLSAAVQSIKNGKPNNAAKAIYDFWENAVNEGGVEIEDKSTGQRAFIPINEYLEAFAEPTEPLTVESVDNLPFDPMDDIFNFEIPTRNEQERVQRKVDETASATAEGSTKETGSAKEDSRLSAKAQAEERLKAAQSSYDKAQRALKSAEDKISSKQATQSGMFDAPQSELFGVKRDEAKSILDPLRAKAKEAKAELDAANKAVEIAGTSQQELLPEDSNKKLADAIRSKKLKGGGLKSEIIPTFGLSEKLVNKALDMIADQVEKGTKLGNAIAKVIRWVDSVMGGKKWDKGGFAKHASSTFIMKVGGQDVLVTRDDSKETAEMIDGFYSSLEQSILDAKGDNHPANEWLSNTQIFGLKSFNQEEAQWTGIKDFLQSKGSQKVSKKELRDFMKNNRVEIVEVVKGGEDAEKLKKQIEDKGYEFERDMSGDPIITKDGEFVDDSDLPEDIRDLAERYYNATFDESNEYSGTKYEKYQLPGEKSNYKEVLVTLPSNTETQEGFKYYDKDGELIGETMSEARAKEWVAKDGGRYEADIKKGQDFKSSHWDEPNILVHLRMNTRTDAEGKKVLFIEEVQSDWGQKGKREGFDVKQDPVSELTIQQKKEINARMDLAQPEYTKLLSLAGYIYNAYSEGQIKVLSETPIAKRKEMVEERHREKMKSLGIRGESDFSRHLKEVEVRNFNRQMEINALAKLNYDQYVADNETWHNITNQQIKSSKASIPAAPFVTETNSWVKLGLKVALKNAVKQGVDKIAWTTGEQQNERYDLSKQVDAIEYYEAGTAASDNSPMYRVAFKDKNGERHDLGSLRGDELEAYVGKEMANKIINYEGEASNKYSSVFGNDYGGNPQEYKVLSGLDLKVGGKGMKGFYGDPQENKTGIIGSVAKALVKELTGVEGEIGETKVFTGEDRYNVTVFQSYTDSSKWIVQWVDPDGMNGQKSFSSKTLADKFADGINGGREGGTTQHSIEVTPQLKESVQQGMPLFGEAKTKSKLQQIADKIEKDGILPSFLKADLPEGTQLSGWDSQAFNKAVADALRTVDAILKSTKNLAVAIGAGLDQLKTTWYERHAKHWDEERLRKDFTAFVIKELGISSSHLDTSILREKYGFEQYERDPETVAEWTAEAFTRIAKGEFPALVDKLRKGGIATEVEQIMITKAIADLDAQILQNPTDELLARQKELIQLDDLVIGSAWGKLGRARQERFRGNQSISDYYVAKMEANGVDTLTEEQKKDVQQKYAEYEKTIKDLESKLSNAEEENRKLKSRRAFERVKRESVSRKSKAERVKERDEIKKSIKEKWNKASNDNTLTAVPVPYAKQLVAIAPDVAKLMKSYVEEGVDNLRDIVRNIHADVVEVIPEVTEKDIQDIIAGEYGQQKETEKELRNKLADLRNEAQLILKLEALENGVVPANEKAQRKRNEAITELRKQIKDHGMMQLSQIKKRNEAALQKINERISNKDFAPANSNLAAIDNPDFKKAYPKLWKEAMDAIVAKEDAKHELDIMILKDEMARRNKFEKFVDFVAKAINTAKAFAAGIDNSAVWVQNMVALLAHPQAGGFALKEHVLDAVSEKRFKRNLAALHHNPMWHIMVESGLDVTEPKSITAEKREEIFANRFEPKITISGKTINVFGFLKPFERAFTSLGNNLRVHAFLHMAEKMAAKGITFENNRKEYESLAKILNNETGRGTLNKTVRDANALATTVLWSPRLLASSFNVLGLGEASGKGYYRNMTPRMRAYAIMNVGKYVGSIGLLMGVLAVMGAEADLDPRSVTFGTVKIGNKRYNLYGRFSGVVKLVAQNATQSKKIDGKTIPFDNKAYFGKTTGSEALKFLRGKLTPFLGTMTDVALGRDYNGKPIENYTTHILRGTIVPLSLREVSKTVDRDGISGIFNTTIPSFMGINVGDDRDFEKKTDYTDEDLNDPIFKYFTDKGVKIPEVNEKSVPITDEEAGTKKKLTDYGEQKVKEYISLRNKLLKEELEDILANGFVYVDKYGGVSTMRGKDKEETDLSDLNAEQLKEVLSIAAGKATKRTKDELFYSQ